MLREFNELEILSYAVGQPFNIAVMLKIKGEISVDLLESAFVKLQEKHPLLKVRVILNDKNMPCFTSENVGSIPITIIDRKNDSQALDEFHCQLTTPFDFENEKLPLARVILFSSPKVSELIICTLHSISDGYSMIFLVRDLLQLMINPKDKITTLAIPSKDVDLLTPKIRKMVPKRPVFQHLVYGLLRIYNFFRYVFVGKRKTAEINIKENEMGVYNWKLTKSQTSQLLDKCKQKEITVHSAISTAFISDYRIIGSPVNLRNRLNIDVGESFGFYSGVAIYKMRYRKKLDFWKNARKLQKRLLKGLRDRKLFVLQKFFAKSVPVKLLRKIGTYYIEIVTNKEPFSIDNLGLLEKYLKDIDFDKFPTIESFFGGITSFLNAFIVLFYTLRGEMHFYFHYTKSKYTLHEMKILAEVVRNKLLNAIEK
ncbi:MAG: hypothetical protein FK733_17450 [Asgard group archaeon]|nr:hypothetical protein [Asgard group archaeon]